MKIYKLENIKEIHRNETLKKLMSFAMFNATDGRIKSAAESIYAKEQGRFYVAEEDDYVGICGVRRIDNQKVDIMHIAVDETLRKQGIATKMIQAVNDIERVKEIHAETDDDAVNFYRKLGFKVTEVRDKYTDVLRYECVYRCK